MVLEGMANSLVIPKDNPVFVNAERTSNMIGSRSCGCQIVSKIVEMKKSVIKVKKIINDLSIVSCVIVFLIITTSLRDLATDPIFANKTAAVVSRIPPPVLEEAPPMNMRNIRQRTVVMDKLDTSRVVKPPFLDVADKKKALVSLSHKFNSPSTFVDSNRR